MRHSIPSARCLAALLFTAAIASGCGMVQRYLPGMDAPAPMPAFDGDPAHIRDMLRVRRERAALAAREGRSATDYGPREALMLSMAEHALDAAAAWTDPPSVGRALFDDLPRKHWWYLFVEPSRWAEGPLAIDRAGTPGFYAAMMNAFDEALVDAGRASGAATAMASTYALAAPPPAPTVDDYVAMHQLVTMGVYDQAAGRHERQGFATEPMSYAVAPLHDPNSTSRELLARSLAEMKAEGLAGWNSAVQREKGGHTMAPWLASVLESVADVNPHSKAAHLIYAREKAQDGSPHFAQWLRGWNHFTHGEARDWAAQWLAAYADEQKQLAASLSGAAYLDALASGNAGESMIAALRPACRLIRRLEVSHVFASGVQRLDTRLLLNKLLVAQGLPPTILRDATIFAGRMPVDELAREVIRGQQHFQHLVAELASREAASPSNPSAN